MDHVYFEALNPERGDLRFAPSAARIEEWGLRTRTGTAALATMTLGLVALAVVGVASNMPMLFFVAGLPLLLAVPGTLLALNELRFVGGSWENVVVPSSFTDPEQVNSKIMAAEAAGVLPPGFPAKGLYVDKHSLLAQVAELLSQLSDPRERFAFARAARELHDARILRAELALEGKTTSAQATHQLVFSLEKILDDFQMRESDRANRAAEDRRALLSAVAEIDALETFSTKQIDHLTSAVARATAELTVSD